MKKLYDKILHKRLFILIFFALITLFAGIQVFKTKINPDIASYLSDSSMSKKTIHELQQSFMINGDIVVGIGESTLDENSITNLNSILDQIKAEHDEIQEIDWIGNPLNRALFLAYNETFTGVNDLLLMSFDTWTVTPEKKTLLAQTLHRYFQVDEHNQGCFIVYFSLTSSNTSEETYSIINRLVELLQVQYEDYFIGGTANQGKAMLDSALTDLPKFLIAALIIVFLILLLTTKSIIEPFIFLITIGIAIVLNLGTNFFSGSISTVTFSAAAILQLALAMDYSIFLMHRYYYEKTQTDNRLLAMKNALLSTNRSIAASALTTIGGFVALFAMQFRLGFDLGFVLAKGVLFILITYIFFQQCLILILDKWIEKTSHKYFHFSFKRISKGLNKTRFLGLLALLILFVPALIFQNKVSYYYLDSRINEEAIGAESIINRLGSQLIVIVNEADDTLKQTVFLQEIIELNQENPTPIHSVIGYYPMLAQLQAIVDETHPAFAQFQAMDLPNTLASKFINNNKTYYIIQMQGAGESQGVLANNRAILSIMNEKFSTYYATGNSQIVIDFQKTTKSEFLVVSLLSAILIFLILLFTYKSLLTPLILLIVIELGIFINLAITYFIGVPINFVSYLIISAIQLGATVDYAILLKTRYREQQSAEKAIQQSGMSIIVSIAILLSACMSVYFIASDPIIKEITFLIARGSVISGLLVFFVLPRLLLVFSKKERI